MTLASLSRATRRGLATFLFWWRLPPVSGPRKAIRDELETIFYGNGDGDGHGSSHGSGHGSGPGSG